MITKKIKRKNQLATIKTHLLYEGKEMENKIIKEFLNLGNDQDKNEYIRDLSNSICTYVKTGNKSELLDSFLAYADEIKCEIKQILSDKEEIINIILNGSYTHSENSKDGKLPKQAEIKWENCMKNIMYLSHLNMLYDIYMHEAQLKKE